MKSLSQRICQFMADKRMNRNLRNSLTAVAAVVVFVTTYALILPALTLEKGALICGLEVHEHTDSCYSQELSCNIPESEGHHHTDSCYKTSEELTCSQTEHLHNDACMDEEGNVICGLEEHQHQGDCYTSRVELICGQEEYEGHTHNENCYTQVLTCGKEYHMHTDACYSEAVEEEPVMETPGENYETETGDTQEPKETEKEKIEETSKELTETEEGEETEESIDSEENQESDESDECESSGDNPEGEETSEDTSEDTTESEETTAEEETTEAEETAEVEETTESVEVMEPVEFATTLTEETGIWRLTQDQRWERLRDGDTLTANEHIMVRLAYRLPQGSLEANQTYVNTADTYDTADLAMDPGNYVLPMGFIISDETAAYINQDDHYLNQIVTGSRLPEITREEYSGDEYLAGRYELVKDSYGRWILTTEWNEYAMQTSTAGELSGWLMFYLTGADLSTDTEGNATILFAEDATTGFQLGINLHVQSEETAEETTEEGTTEEFTTEEETNEAENPPAETTEAEGETSSEETSEVAEETSAEETSEVAEETSAEETSEVEEETPAEETNEVAEETLTEEAELPAQTFRETTDTVTVNVVAPEGAFPPGTRMTVTDIDDQATVDTITESIQESNGPKKDILKVQAVDITFYDAAGQKIEPGIPIQVVITPMETPVADQPEASSIVVHITDDGEAEVIEQKAQEDIITPEDVIVTEDVDVEETNPSENDQQNQEETSEATNEESQEITSDVTTDEKDISEEFYTDLNDNAVVFDADAFSVYAIAYTVDFHYEVNGKMYEFSIPGGGFASFYKIVEVLGISEQGTQSGSGDENEEIQGENVPENDENTYESTVHNVVEEARVEDTGTFSDAIKLNNVEVSEATREFVADVASVEFSNPELVWVGKADSETTVGGLKEANALEVEYSAELTEEQIAEINAQTVDAGDWVLISVLPFTSEESLTVTMKNGEQFVVKVTDGQRPYTNVNDLEEGTYIIYKADTDSQNRSVQHYLKNDGTTGVIYPATSPLNASNLSAYTWNVTKSGNSFVIKSTQGNRYINLYGNTNEKDKWSSSSYATLSLSGSNGIVIKNGNKSLNRNIGDKFYITTGNGVAFTFFKIEDNNSGGTSGSNGIVLTDAERQRLKDWKDTLNTFNTLSHYNKTAEVCDNGDNRIYKIDICADSGITDFYQDVDLGFVLDVSMSMKFPSSLKALEDSDGNEYQAWMSQTWLDSAKTAYSSEYNKEGCFYVISDPAVTSTVYKVYWDTSTRSWRYHDASEEYPMGSTNSRVYNITDTTVFPKDIIRQPYTLYYADDKDLKSRFDYLKESVDLSVATLKKIVTPTANVDDETASVRVAYNLFCKEITSSDVFKDLRSQTVHDTWSIPLVVANMGSGTRQNIALYDENYDPSNWWSQVDTGDGYSANEFGWDNNNQQYVILVTDGAPNGPSIKDVKDAADYLRSQYPNVKIFTIGLSTQDVDGGSQMLYDIADYVDGQKQFYEAEKAQDLEYILLKILRTILTEGIVRGKIIDTIDEGFYPVDAQGNPLSEGVYNASGKINGAQINSYVSNGKPTKAHANEAFYTWEQVGDEWKIIWYNQEIGWNDNDASTGNPWTGTVYVKAKEDYLGGNLIETNDGHAQIEPTGLKLVINGTPETNWRPLEGMTPIDLPVPRVNVHNLETKENSTTWTVCKGTSVTPKEQLEALWNAIPIEEVVSATQDNGHKITTGQSANIGTAGAGETFSLGSLMSEVAPSFNIDSLIDQITATKSSASQEFTYTAYGHESGKITVKVERTVGNQTPAAHTADTVGAPVEQYKVTFTYKPYTEAERMNGKVKDPSDTDHHNGSNGRGEEETGEIRSENTHTINVFQKGIKVTKVDKTNLTTVLPGAVFELFRVEPAGQADVSAYTLPTGTYSKVGGDLTADSDGLITINPLIPDKDSAVIGKTLYEPNISVGANENTSHDTVFYLVEKTPPVKPGTTYARMPGAIKFTMTLTEDKGTDSTAALYNWTQTAVVSATEYENGTNSYLIEDGENNNIYEYRLKNSTYGGLKILKHVTYNHQNPTTSVQKSKLAGSYRFTIFTDEECTAPYLEDGHEKMLTVIINADGISQSSQEVSLPPGKYWIKENEPENDAYPLQEKVEVTVESDQTGEHAVIAAFTNNINEGEDETMITVKKTFSGITSAEIPDDFSVTVTNGTDTYVLTKQPQDQNITWAETAEGLVWTWRIFGITPGTTYTVSESGEEVSGYTVTPTGTGSSQTISPAQMTFTIAEIATTCSHNDWLVSENTLFAASTTSKTGGKGTLIVTKNRLSLSERKAVEEYLRPMLVSYDANVWKTPVRYYSVEDNPTGFKINAGVVTYNVDDQEVILSDTDIWQHVASVTFTKTDPASADFNVTNTYQKRDIAISLVKVDVNHLNDENPAILPGATFTVEKYKSLSPAEKDTEWGTNGSITIADTEETGTFLFEGLSAGYYKIIEDIFPAGYIQTTDAPIIEVRADETTGELEVYLLQKGEEHTYVDVSGNNDGVVKIANKIVTVGNTSGVALPNTGGPGTTMIYLLGIMLTGLAGAGLVMKRRRRNVA